MELKNRKSNEVASMEDNKKTWLELTDKELEVLKVNAACMYGRKEKVEI